MFKALAIFGIITSNLFTLYIASIIASEGNPGAALLILGVLFIFQKWFYDSRPIHWPARRIVACSDAPRATAEFAPTHYYRMVRRKGWRNVEVEIDEAVEIPDSEIVPVEFIVKDDDGKPYLFYCYVVRFEYRGQVMTGQFFGDI